MIRWGSRHGPITVYSIRARTSGTCGDVHRQGESGVGRGETWFQVSKAGKPLAYRWSKADGKVHKIRMTIGRPVSFVD